MSKRRQKQVLPYPALAQKAIHVSKIHDRRKACRVETVAAREVSIDLRLPFETLSICALYVGLGDFRTFNDVSF